MLAFLLELPHHLLLLLVIVIGSCKFMEIGMGVAEHIVVVEGGQVAYLAMSQHGLSLLLLLFVGIVGVEDFVDWW